MKRSELEHIIRAASAITLHQEFVIIGSQALLATNPDLPEQFLVSVEADVYPKEKPEDSLLIDGAIGEGSAFHDTFGYYAHGVGPETATLPRGWADRLVPIRNANTHGATGWCLAPDDLAISKLVAGREKDLPFVRRMIEQALTDTDRLRARLASTDLSADVRERCEQRLMGMKS
jgi:hypothetical protein